MKYAFIVCLLALVMLYSCNNTNQRSNSPNDSASITGLDSQAGIIFPLKPGDKLHYQGTLITDSSSDYPTDRPFSEKEFNKEYTINDLVLTVDTVITVEDYTFVRFLLTTNQPALDSSGADFNFIFSSEPRRAFNLIFYKKEIYTVEPPSVLDVLAGISGNPGDSINKYKIDTRLDSIYGEFYKKHLTASGCLQQMLHNRVLLSNGVDSMHIIGNGEGCDFHLDPFINTVSTKAYSSKEPVFGEMFNDFLKYDSLPGEFGGKVAIFGGGGNDSYVNDSVAYYYSEKYFIPKLSRSFKWSRSMHGQHRKEPPCKYTLTLYKIDSGHF